MRNRENTSQPLDMPHREEIVVVIPAYNEARFIGSVALMAAKFASTIIVVDDGSSDATAVVAAASGAVICQHASNQGKGSALNSGFRLAREYDPKVVVTLDADGQTLTRGNWHIGSANSQRRGRYCGGLALPEPYRYGASPSYLGALGVNLLARLGSGCIPPIHRADSGVITHRPGKGPQI